MILEDVTIEVMTSGDDNIIDPLFRNIIRTGALEGTLYFVMESTDGDISKDTPRLVEVSVWFGPGRTLNSGYVPLSQCGLNHLPPFVQLDTDVCVFSEEQKTLALHDFSRLSPEMQEWRDKIVNPSTSRLVDPSTYPQREKWNGT